ncbi:DUF1499 domain-containing protein [Lysobacter korlensis]|uniref:DUF1499 domain-containing protein n=1 Tax=Lysobacter korlensis TaxID=553636 RepID=A0ABV6RK74_9GAMM
MKPARIALALSVIAAIVLLVAGPGTRLDAWHFGIGLQMLRWAAYLGLAGAAVAIVLLLIPSQRRASTGALLLAAVLGVAVAAVPWMFMRQVKSVPPIHDITTDTQRPPEFLAVLPLRKDATNPVAYGGAEIAQQQQAAYPDLQPLRLEAPPAAAFDRALQAARSMGWEIVAADPATGRIEATDTTFWFGFKDDVVIRVEADGAGSRIDVRSLSRVGGSDVGANAKRIRAYLDTLGG